MRIADKRSILALGITSAYAIVALVEPAFAYRTLPDAAPGPLIGLGLPAAGAVIGSLYLLRFFQRR